MASKGSSGSQGSRTRKKTDSNSKGSSGSRSSGGSSRSKGSGGSGSKEPQKRSLSANAEQQREQQRRDELAPRIRNDIAGVVFIAIAVILMLAVCVPSDAFITSRLATGLHYGLGVGAYLLPVFVLVFGVCFFLMSRYHLILPRIAVGMLLIFLGIITLLGVNAPGVVNHEQALFAEAYLLGYGGYIGNALAYVLLTLVGKAISWVLVVAVIVGALVLIGFSISGFFDWLFDRRREKKEQEEYVAPYGRARGVDTGGGPSRSTGGFVPASGSIPADPNAKTRVIGHGSKTAKTQVLGSDPSATTQLLDGQGQTVLASNLETRRLNGADEAEWVAAGSSVPVPEGAAAAETVDLRHRVSSDVGVGPSRKGPFGRSRRSAASKGDAWAREGASAAGADVTVPLDIGRRGVSGSDGEPSADETVAATPDARSADRSTGHGASPASGATVASGAPGPGADASEDGRDAESMEGEDAAKAMAAAAASGAVGPAAVKAKRASRRRKKTAEKTQLLADSSQSEKEEGGFQLPDPKILKKSQHTPRSNSSGEDLAAMGAQLQETLHEFNVDADVVGWVHGPTVTLFKVALASGVRVNKVTALADDIALAFASQSVRIFSPIAGTSLVGIEIPNDTRENVLLGDVLPSAGEKPLLLAIGKDVEGNAITADLAKMPHLLIGGTTGSGKSVAINSMIMSVLMRATPDQVRMILIDPKRVELSLYNDIPHLYVPVVTDPHKAASALAWAVQEMERRLKLFEEVGARNITQYAKLREDALADIGKRRAELEARAAELEAMEASDVPGGADADETMALEQPAGDAEGAAALTTAEDVAEALEDLEDEAEGWEQMPSIMIVIDELADLMMVAGKEVETSISRIAQLARAAGIHMIVATQRPSTNVITGLIKANITNRIAFNVASGVDSRVILDTTGAENLIGLGDMLFSKPEFGKPLRVQGCFVGEDEINKVCKFLREQGKPDYHEDILTTSVPILESGSPSGGSGGGSGSDDDLLWEAAEIVVSSNLGSTSALQRRLKVGYARAGRIMDMLEDKGIVGPANGSKPREVYVDELELESLKALDQAGKL